jgi:hypothetical protein
MAQLDKTRPSTPLERQVAQAVADIAAELGLESIDPKLVSESVVAGLREAGLAVCDALLETMDEAFTYEEEQRKGFEQRLQRLWSPALERLQALIIGASEAGATFALERRKAGRWGPRDEALVRIHARACLIAREVLTLLRAGYASGAHARWRSLHELAVTAFFVSEHGEEVAEAYLLHAAVASRKAARTYQANAETLGYRPLSDLERNRVEAQVQLLAGKYGKSYLGDWGWAAKQLDMEAPTFHDIEKAVKMGHLRPYYQMANHAVHAGSKGLYFDLGAEASRGSILLAGASNTGLSDPGQRAAISLHQATAALLASDITAERNVVAVALQGFTDATIEAFAARDAQAENLVSLHRGFASRRTVFARREATRRRHDSRHLGTPRRRPR